MDQDLGIVKEHCQTLESNASPHNAASFGQAVDAAESMGYTISDVPVAQPSFSEDANKMHPVHEHEGKVSQFFKENIEDITPDYVLDEEKEVAEVYEAEISLGSLLKLAGLKDAQQVQTLTLAKRRLKSVPDVVCQNFPNLVTLDLSDNLLQRFPSKTNFKVLKDLRLDRNNIRSVKELTSLKSLEYLNISGNSFLQVSDRYKLVSVLTNLKMLDGKDVDTTKEATRRLDQMFLAKLKELFSKPEAAAIVNHERSSEDERKIKMVALAKKVITCGPSALEDYRDFKLEQLIMDQYPSFVQECLTLKRKTENLGSLGSSKKPRDKVTISGSLSPSVESPTGVDIKENVESYRYRLTHLLQTHHHNNDPTDLSTKVWMCEFEPNLNNPAETTSVCATCGGDSVCFIDCSNGQVLKKFKQPKEEFYCLAWTVMDFSDEVKKTSKKITMLATAGILGDIKLIDPSQLVCYQEICHHKKAIDALLFHPKIPHWLFSGSEDRSIVLWDLGSPFTADANMNAKKLFTLKASSTGTVRQIAVLPHGKILIAACDDGCYAWQADVDPNLSNSRQPRYRFTFPGDKKKPLDSVHCLSDYVVALKRVEEGKIQLWQSPSQFLQDDAFLSHVLTWRQTETPFLKFNFIAATGFLLAGDDQGYVWLYNLIAVIGDAASQLSQKSLSASTKRGTHKPIAMDAAQQLFCGSQYTKLFNHVSASSSRSYIVGVTDTNVVAIWKKQ